MTGFNLPPGVNVSDIPGNRPEDLAEERFWEELEKRFEKNFPQYQRAIVNLTDIPHVEDALREYVTLARDMGYEQGFAEGKDERMIEDAPQLD